MSLAKQIDNDLISALKEKNEVELSTLRLLKSAIKNKEIATCKPADDSIIQEVIVKEIKQRRDSINQYQQGNRQNLADRETAELNILQKYLPKQMSEIKISQLLKEAISKTNAQNISQMGQVMAELMPQIKGQADPSLVSQMVKNKLNK